MNIIKEKITDIFNIFFGIIVILTGVFVVLAFINSVYIYFGVVGILILIFLIGETAKKR